MTAAASHAVARIVKLEPAHRDAVRRILESTDRFREAEVAVALELFDATFGLGGVAKDPDYRMLGAFGETGDLLGFVTYGPTPQTDGTWDLYWIATASSAQGRGIGGAMLAEVEKRILALGARLLLIETSSRDDYDSARKFYSTRGYVEQARIRDFYAVADDRLLLTKSL
jgi:ribosomal protein S18 acetylase RimI-like enzyme